MPDIPTQIAPASVPRLWTNFAALRSRQMGRYLVRGRIRFCTFQQLVTWSIDWARTLPRDVDAIVGMPRSGLIVANTVAEEMKKPLSTPELLAKGLWWNQGTLQEAPACARVLVMDDSVNSGTQLGETMSALRRQFPETRFESAVLLPHQKSYRQCDHFYKIVRAPRVFEWDIMHTKKYSPIAFDFDGVLCEDCDHQVDVDEASYLRFLEEAQPRFIPQYTIDYIISNRLEMYRPQCEAWLKQHNVRYRHLILWDIDDKSLRCNGFARNKVRQILRLRPKFFVESSFSQSRLIALKTGVPVLCTDRKILFG